MRLSTEGERTKRKLAYVYYNIQNGDSKAWTVSIGLFDFLTVYHFVVHRTWELFWEMARFRQFAAPGHQASNLACSDVRKCFKQKLHVLKGFQSVLLSRFYNGKRNRACLGAVD